MSLLMDALKKAEQEKKAAAKRLQEAQENPEDQFQSQSLQQNDRTLTQELSTEDDVSQHIQQTYDSQDSQDPQVIQEELTTSDNNQVNLDDTSEVDGLALTPFNDKDIVISALEKDDSFVQEPLVHEPDNLSDQENIETGVGETTESTGSPDLDQTYALAAMDLEEMAATQLTVADTTIQDEEVQASVTLAEAADEYEYFSATISAAELAEDIGGDSPTPVAAQTVFSATYSKPDNQVVQWSVFAVLCLAIAGAISFLFIDTIPVERSIKSPLVAKDIETQSEPVPAIEIPDELVSDATLDSSLFTGEITDVIKKENDTVIEQDEKTALEPEQLVLSQENISLSVERDAAENDPAPEVVATVEKIASTLPEKIELSPKLMKISRSTSTDKYSQLIKKAYQEYIAGDYAAAEKSYRIVLRQLPENRDALLGLAAISLRNGDLRQAYANYLEVLRLYPGDSVAEAALINFKQNGGDSRNESILKISLQKDPENSFLHYSLGSLYATQSRWPEAQQSFFDAYRIEKSNPDYAFNLAVSLDHIGQQQSAIEYYNTALNLAGQSTASFNKSVVSSRINALSN